MKGKQIINNRRASYDYRLGDKIVAAEDGPVFNVAGVHVSAHCTLRKPPRESKGAANL